MRETDRRAEVDGFDIDPLPVGVVAEAAALGACLWSADAAHGLVEHLTPDSFQREAHRTVFAAISSLVAEGVVVDPITLSDRLVATGRIDVAGGLAAPFALFTVECCPTPSAWRVYLDIVRRDAERRHAIREHVEALRNLGLDVEVTG